MHGVKLKFLLFYTDCIACSHNKAYVCLYVHRGTMYRCVGLSTCVYRYLHLNIYIICGYTIKLQLYKPVHFLP